MPNASKYIVIRDRKILKRRTGNFNLNGRITLMEVDYGLSSSPFYDLNTLGLCSGNSFLYLISTCPASMIISSSAY